MFLSFRKNKETKCTSVQTSKKFKKAAVSLSKMCRSKIFVTQQNFLRTLEIHYQVFDNSHLKFGKREKAKKKACSTTRFDFCRLSKKCGFPTFPEIQAKLCQFEFQKVEQNSTVFKKQTSCLSVFYLNVTQNSIRTFQNGLGEIHDVCGSEDIKQSRFHAKLFKYK